MQLVESVRDLGLYGPAKPPAEHGLDEASFTPDFMAVLLPLRSCRRMFRFQSGFRHGFIAVY